MQLIFSAFPGCGKSTLFRKAPEYGLVPCQVAKNEDGVPVITTPPAPAGSTYLFDSDSSLFDKSNFPHNYIEHIKGIMESYENVIILVSSHEEVRAALSANGIEYILVYPDRSLKEEFIQRYIDRGSPESFVKMMEEKWDVFIDSCVNKLSSHNQAGDYVLKSGEGLADAYTREMEFIRDLEEKLKREMMKGPNPFIQKAFGETFSDIKELDANMKQDISVLEEQIARHEENEVSGMEGRGVNPKFGVFRTYAKQAYGIEIDDSIAGLESFMDKLREAVKKVKGVLKNQANKQGMLQVKRYITDCDKAIKLYGSESWLNSQTFKDGGECTIGTVPAGLTKVRSVGDVAGIVLPFVTETVNISKSLEKDARNRIVLGLKIWNRFKNAKGDVDTVSTDIQNAIDNLKLPERIKFDKEKYGEKFKGPSEQRVRLPVLDKDGVKEAVKIITAIYQEWLRSTDAILQVAEDGISWDDVYDIDLFLELVESNKSSISHLMKLICWEDATTEMNELENKLESVGMPIAQMLENWIIYSVE